MRHSLPLTLALAAAMIPALATPAAAAAPETCKTGNHAQNIALAKNFYKAYNTGDADLLRRILAKDYVSEPVNPGDPIGVEAAVGRMKFVQATFNPTEIRPADFIAAGNKVVVRSDITVKHVGPFVGVAPTGKTLRFGAIDIHTICNGRIVHGNHEENWMAVMFQLGVLPVKPAAAPQ